MIKIFGVGDIMPGGILSGVNSGYASNEIYAYLSKADIRVGTLETAIGNTPSFNEEKMSREGDVIYCPDVDAIKLKQLGINIVSLANNHFFDLGVEGAKHTIELLDNLGIKHVGAGSNLEEASQAVVENINNETVAFIGFCDLEYVGWCPYATTNTTGVNPMYENHMISEISKYKELYDYVVVLAHWGAEHTYTTTSRVHKLAKIIMNAGADLILGSHPHRIQPVVNFNKCSIAYSMGNFFFPNRLLAPPSSTYYSNSEIDISKLPTTDSFPNVEEITYKKWKPLALVGMIVDSTLSIKGTKSSYQLTIMEDGCYLKLYDNPSIRRTLNFRKFLIKYTPYSFMCRMFKFINYIRRKLTHLR